MLGRRYWVDVGKVGTVADEDGTYSQFEERKRFDHGQVRLTTGDLGTEIKWHVQSPCHSSLYAAMDWLVTAKSPFVLRFYVSGWFEEFHRSYQDVMRRLEDIVARGDRHFTTRTMVRQFELKDKPLPDLITECLNSPASALDYAVECAYEDGTEQFAVDKIGPKSVINQVWGPFPSSFPCLPTSQYGKVVSQAYHEVSHSGKPRYDHVLAAMRMPDNVLFWVPYHRLVLPKKSSSSKPTVLVIAELSQVDIKLI
jgi:hypothetical protein